MREFRTTSNPDHTGYINKDTTETQITITNNELFIPFRLHENIIKMDSATSNWNNDKHNCQYLSIESLNHKPTKITFKNGNIYEGQVIKGVLHGEGKLSFPNGTIYVGDFKLGKIQGKGVLSYPDGSLYEGRFDNGVKQGKGTYKSPNSKTEYKGEWEGDFRQGKGVLTYKNGSRYIGEFKRGRKHGRGKLIFKSGNYYDGDWQNNKKQGQGSMFWVDTKQTVNFWIFNFSTRDSGTRINRPEQATTYGITAIWKAESRFLTDIRDIFWIKKDKGKVSFIMLMALLSLENGKTI